MDVKELIVQFEEIMSAAAFAEAGAFDDARKFLRERKVLLVLTGMESDMKAAKYAINVSKRMEAVIEILYIAHNSKEKSFLEEYLRELKTIGIDYQVTMGKGDVKEEVRRFIEKMNYKDIRLIVIDSEDIGTRAEDGQKAELNELNNLQCPVVLVSGQAGM